MMKILLTNDDGIYAPGIAAIAKTLTKIADVTVVAPDSERSAVSHAITLAHPIWVKKVNRDKKFFGYSISGTPADCVKFGIDVILKSKPDLVISGINLGDNDGCSVFYSGTVAGAREGALLGIPSMAVSLATFSNPDFTYAAKLAVKLAQKIFLRKLPCETFLNVNVPNLPKSRLRGICVTRQGMTPIHGKFHKRFDPNSREYYWMTGEIPRHKKDLSVDTYALSQGYVTVTPVQCNVTDVTAFTQLQQWSFKI
jgi:5'-nucleotidase